MMRNFMLILGVVLLLVNCTTVEQDQEICSDLLEEISDLSIENLSLLIEVKILKEDLKEYSFKISEDKYLSRLEKDTEDKGDFISKFLEENSPYVKAGDWKKTKRCLKEILPHVKDKNMMLKGLRNALRGEKDKLGNVKLI